MGLLALKRLISKHHQDRRRRQIQGHHDGSIGSLAKRKGSPCEQDDNSQTAKRIRYSEPHLPEDIWHHIHSLVPLRDAARAACVCHAFLRSWRCYPNLSFRMRMFGLKESLLPRSKKTRDYNSKVDHIFRNHSGVGVKALRLEVYGPYNSNTSDYLDSWLQVSVTPVMEELTVIMNDTISNKQKKYSTFPCSHLSDGRGSSIRHLQLAGCAFRPALGMGCLSNLRRVFLRDVRITGDELGWILSNSFSLEWLDLVSCKEIVSLKVPTCLLRLRYLHVFRCRMLQAVEIKAPNIYSFDFIGEQVQLLLGESLQMKRMRISHSCALHHACAKLLPSMPNLEQLTMCSLGEVVNTPMLPNQFLHLKYLHISFDGWNFSSAYDLLSLVSFLDASPSLQTFHLDAPRLPWMQDSILQDTSPLRQMTPHPHGNQLKRVKITNFSSSRMLIELVRHVLENSKSLECLILDITPGEPRCSAPNGFAECDPMPKHVLLEAPKAFLSIYAYILKKVPPTAKVDILKLYDRCHPTKRKTDDESSGASLE